MASAGIVSIDLGIAPEQLRCIAGILDPSAPPWQRAIEMSALHALCGVQHRADVARRLLGLPIATDTLQIRIVTTPACPETPGCTIIR